MSSQFLMKYQKITNDSSSVLDNLSKTLYYQLFVINRRRKKKRVLCSNGKLNRMVIVQTPERNEKSYKLVHLIPKFITNTTNRQSL